MRDLTTGMETALQQRVVRPVLIGKLDIKNDPVTAWTGHGIFAPTGSSDAQLDGETFDSTQAFVSMTSIQEDQGVGGPVTITAKGHDLDEDLLRQIVRDKRSWRARRAYLWLGLLDVDEVSVIDDPVRIKTGFMTQMNVYRSDNESAIDITIDVDLSNVSGYPFRWIDHTRIWSEDKFSTYIVQLSNSESGFIRNTMKPSMEEAHMEQLRRDPRKFDDPTYTPDYE